MWRTPVGVMRVGGEEVNPVPVKKFVGDGLRHGSKAAIQSACSYLQQATLAHPVCHQLGLAVQGRVPLRVSDDDGVASCLQPEECIGKLRRNCGVWKLDEQVSIAVDRVLKRMGPKVGGVFRRKVEIPPKAQFRQAVEFSAQLTKTLFNDRASIGEF